MSCPDAPSKPLKFQSLTDKQKKDVTIRLETTFENMVEYNIDNDDDGYTTPPPTIVDINKCPGAPISVQRKKRYNKKIINYNFI